MFYHGTKDSSFHIPLILLILLSPGVSCGLLVTMTMEPRYMAHGMIFSGHMVWLLLWVLIFLLPVLVWIMYPAKSTSQYIMHNHHSEIIRWWRASCTCFWWYDVPAAEWRRSRQQTRMQDAQNVSVRRCQQQEVGNSGSSSRLYHGLMIPLMLSDALTSLLKHNENDWPDARGIQHRLFWCSAGWIQLPSPSHQLSAPLNSQFQPEVVPQLSAVTSSSTSLL